MKTSERLLNASKTIWDAYNEHPFVLGIQNGTLERDKFRYYIMQDFLYLKDYAKTYAVGVAKAKSVETANLFAKYINVMNGELDPIIDALTMQEQAEKLRESTEA